VTRTVRESGGVGSGWLNERSRNGGVDEIPLPSSPGRLWLCGKHFVGPDVEAALERTGAASVVCLNEAAELRDRYPAYVAWLTAHAGGRAVWFPIHDLHAPDLDAVRPLLADLGARLARGDGLLLHCGAGVGRAGTIAASLLLRLGLSLEDALASVAAHRPTAGPQTDVQADFLVALAAAG
jgi:protein-tyrosine phosphatase